MFSIPGGPTLDRFPTDREIDMARQVTMHALELVPPGALTFDERGALFFLALERIMAANDRINP